MPETPGTGNSQTFSDECRSDLQAAGQFALRGLHSVESVLGTIGTDIWKEVGPSVIQGVETEMKNILVDILAKHGIKV